MATKKQFLTLKPPLLTIYQQSSTKATVNILTESFLAELETRIERIDSKTIIKMPKQFYIMSKSVVNRAKTSPLS